MDNTDNSKAEIACAVAEMVEDEIYRAAREEAYFALSYLMIADGRPRFTIEYEPWLGGSGVAFFSVETHGDEWYRIVLEGEQYRDWLAIPWPVRAFVACYNDMIKTALQGIDKLDAIIQHEKEAA